MFYEGDIQSGIAQAVRESKKVICFIRDQSPQSSVWENEYFQDDEITPLVRSETVCLRLDAGSQEAAMFAALYPVDQIPAVFVIHNGTVTLKLVSHENESTWKLKMKDALQNNAVDGLHTPLSDATPSVPPQTNLATTQTNVAPAATSSTPSTSLNAPDTTVSPSEAQSQPLHAPITEGGSMASSSRTARVQDEEEATDEELYGDPRVRETAAIRRKNKVDPKEGPKNAKGKEPEVSNESKKKATRQDWVQQQRSRNQAQKAERERILLQIKHDREEFKHREQLRQASTGASEQGANDDEGAPEFKESNTHNPTDQYRIQVRLLDGGSIRSSFTGDQTIGEDVREFIDSNLPSNIPYTLKHVLTPLPNRTITDTEEATDLRSLALGPSATLVMVPVQSYTQAYASAGPGLISRGISGGYGLMSSAVGTIYGGVTTFLGMGQPSSGAAPSNHGETAGGGNTPSGGNSLGSGINIRTLADQRRERTDQQFYNGNQLNFEPRPDSEDEDDRRT